MLDKFKLLVAIFKCIGDIGKVLTDADFRAAIDDVFDVLETRFADNARIQDVVKKARETCDIADDISGDED